MRMAKHVPSRRFGDASAMLLAASALVLIGGCYHFRPPTYDEVKTVYVPMFRSVTFRRDVNQQLTEEVIKEIERRTPYKVVGTPEGADAILEGVVNFTDKNLVVENPFNLPRQLTANMTVDVTFTRHDGTPVTRTPVGPGQKAERQQPTTVTQVFNFFPEVGETSMAAFLRTNQKLAEEIVGMMERPW